VQTEIQCRFDHCPNRANIVPIQIKAYANGLGAQARFSSTENLFLISSHSKEVNCCIRKF